MKQQEEAFIKRIKEIISGKKCIFYGFGTTGRNMMLTFEDYGMDVAYVVDMNYEKMKSDDIFQLFRKDYEVKSPYDLAYDVGYAIVLVMADPVRYGNDIKELLEGFGYVHGQDYFLTSDFVSYPLNCIDPLLGYSRRYKDGRYGLKIYGDENLAKHRIVTIGGSTTAPGTYLAKPWPMFLYEKIQSQNVCIYNGGISGYDSSQELLKLIRDCLCICPSVVISYSGYNDLFHMLPHGTCNKYPYVSLYMQDIMQSLIPSEGQELILGLGEDSQDSPAQIWIKNQKIMYAICKGLGIQYIGILQPCLGCIGEQYELSETEKKRLCVEAPGIKDICKEFYKEIDETNVFSDWLFDGRDVFGKKTDLFYDVCHVKECGNEMIAEYILGVMEQKECL